MSNDLELKLLRRVTGTENFLNSVIFDDKLEDWTLARDFGELLVRLIPEYLGSHLIFARAYRHLGDLPRASEQIRQCRAIVERGTLVAMEQENLLPVLEREERLLSAPQ